MSITSIIYFGMAYLRYVIVPALGAISNYYRIDNILISKESLNIAILLMIFEFITATLVLIILEHSNMGCFKVNKQKLQLQGSKKGYVLFTLFTLVIYLIFGRNLDLKINFLFLKSSVQRTTDNVDTIVSFMNLLISASLFFLILLILYKLRKKYDVLKENGKSASKYLKYSLLISLFPIFTIFGERRVSILNVAIGYMVLLIAMYPEYKSRIIKNISIAAGIVILAMTLYKSLSVFLYDSYLEALGLNKFNLMEFSCMLDSYFFGIKTVARNSTFAKSGTVGFLNLFFDIFRNIFGLSFLFKGSGYTTSELFNLYKTGGRELTGTLFSSCGYAYCFLGIMGSALDMCIKIVVLFKIEKYMKKTSYMEWKYIWGYLYSTIAYFMFGSIVMQINSFTRFLFTYAIIIFCSSLLKGKSIYRYSNNNYRMKG